MFVPAMIGSTAVVGLIETIRVGRRAERSGLDVALLGLMVAGTAAAMLMHAQPGFPSHLAKVGIAALLSTLGGLWGLAAPAPGAALVALAAGDAVVPALGLGLAGAVGARMAGLLAGAYVVQCGANPGLLGACARLFGAVIGFFIGGLL